MNRIAAFCLLLCPFLSAVAGAAQTSGPRTYSNPLTLSATVAPLPPEGGLPGYRSRDFHGDPEILHHNGRYYFYATGNESASSLFEPRAALGVRCFSSDNLIDWKDEGLALDARDPERTPFASDMIWSPQVLEARGEFWMFYNATGPTYTEARRKDFLLSSSPYQRLCVARASSPTGPFTEHAAPLFDGPSIPGWVDGKQGVIGSIDAFVYVDTPAGSEVPEYYLYWSGIDDEKNRNLLWGARLRPDFRGLLLPPEGPEPRIVLGPPAQSWETRACGGRLILEAPSLLRLGPTYYLAYSANSFNTPDYAMGYATAPSPLGPFRRSPSNPFLKATLLPSGAADYPLPESVVLGPGSGSFVRSPDGRELLLVYGAVDTRTTESLCSNWNGYARRVHLDRVRVGKDGTLTVEGPTRGRPLPRPSAARQDHPARERGGSSPPSE